MVTVSAGMSSCLGTWMSRSATARSFKGPDAQYTSSRKPFTVWKVTMFAPCALAASGPAERDTKCRLPPSIVAATLCRD